MGKKKVEGKDLIAFRENLDKVSGGMSQEKLAEIIDVTPQTMSKKLTGNGNGIYLGEALAFAHHFGCTLDDLFGFSGKTPEQKETKRLTFRDVARMLVAIDEGFGFKPTMRQIESNEILDPDTCYNTVCVDPTWHQKYPIVSLELEPRYHEYTIYSMEHLPEFGPYSVGVPVYSEGVTDGYIQLNKFLKKYFSWKETLKPDVDKAEWDRHVKIALEKVPKDPAPYTFDNIQNNDPWIPEDLLENDSTTAPEDAPDPTPKQTTSQEKNTAPKKPKKKAD